MEQQEPVLEPGQPEHHGRRVQRHVTVALGANLRLVLRAGPTRLAPAPGHALDERHVREEPGADNRSDEGFVAGVDARLRQRPRRRGGPRTLTALRRRLGRWNERRGCRVEGTLLFCVLFVQFVVVFFTAEQAGAGSKESDLVQQLHVLLPHLADLPQRLLGQERLGQKVSLETPAPRLGPDPAGVRSDQS